MKIKLLVTGLIVGLVTVGVGVVLLLFSQGCKKQNPTETPVITTLPATPSEITPTEIKITSTGNTTGKSSPVSPSVTTYPDSSFEPDAQAK